MSAKTPRMLLLGTALGRYFPIGSRYFDKIPPYCKKNVISLAKSNKICFNIKDYTIFIRSGL